VVVEAELCAAVSDVLHELGFTDFTIRLNDRRVLTAVLLAAGIPAGQHGTALVAVDKLDKIGRDGVERELAERGITPAAASALSAFVESSAAAGRGDVATANAALAAQLRAIVGGEAPLAPDVPPQGDEAGAAGVADLGRILELSSATSAGAHLRLDPSLARGLSYYTGAIMEIAVADLAGSLGGGGRYDGLVGMFSGEAVPACGFSLGLERILVVMGERGMFPASVSAVPADVLVTQWSADRAADALRVAADLRHAGLRVDVYPEPDKLGKQFKYAAARGVPHVVVMGDDEAARGEVTIKNMASGEQRCVSRALLVPALTAPGVPLPATGSVPASGPEGR
jgi:histidyl-tRNA synthetase